MNKQLLDFSIPEAKMHKVTLGSPFALAPWDAYFEVSADELFKHGGLIVDIGGGMRIDDKKGDRAEERRQKLFGKYLKDSKVKYHATDYTDKYHPDSVQDIHKLTFANESVDGLFCLAVLEHVYDPKKAAEEVMRVLKKGGMALIYVPFIYRYHANVTQDYRDYYRYSKDGLAYLFRGNSSIELCPVRGLFESLLRFTPLHRVPGLASLCRLVDWSSSKMKKISERQASGYFVKITK